MADKVQFELVSPERLLMSREVEMVVVPGSEGDFGVLRDHAPLISSIRPGVIEVYEGNAVTDRFFVSGGFAEVTGERVTVLTGEALPVQDINKATVAEELKGLNENLARFAEHADGERTALEKQIEIVEAKLAAVA